MNAPSPEPTELILASVNAKYVHPSLGLRSLYANLGPLQARARIHEFTLDIPVTEVLATLLAHGPRIVGLGVYIWNLARTVELATQLRARCPKLTIILGGPEVSHGEIPEALLDSADYVLCGEADLEFGQLCSEILAGSRPGRVCPAQVLTCPPPELRQLRSPYPYYSASDLRNRLTYVEASRGCPFGCEFCLSSLDTKVRSFELDTFLSEMDALLARGARRFKFVDRTFNLSERHWRPILEFFLTRLEHQPFLHFEIVPDRIPEALFGLVSRFPAGAIQFEVGIQTFDPETAARIDRRQDFARTEENLKRLRSETRVHVHADLIAGLPGESLESFAQGFDRLVALGPLAPHDIQLGILKRLKGAPIRRHTEAYRMRYSPVPPYEILSNDLLDEATLGRIRRFAPIWERYANYGSFSNGLKLLFENRSPFHAFLEFSDWLYSRHGKTHSIPLERRYEFLFEYLTGPLGLEPARAREALLQDLAANPRPNRKRPHFAAD